MQAHLLDGTVEGYEVANSGRVEEVYLGGHEGQHQDPEIQI